MDVGQDAKNLRLETLNSDNLIIDSARNLLEVVSNQFPTALPTTNIPLFKYAMKHPPSRWK
jgi:hypothetical protein